MNSESANENSYTVLFEPAEEGGYVATCPALPGLVTEGDSLEEARANAVDAIRLYLESLRADGLPIPQDKLATGGPAQEIQGRIFGAGVAGLPSG